MSFPVTTLKFMASGLADTAAAAAAAAAAKAVALALADEVEVAAISPAEVEAPDKEVSPALFALLALLLLVVIVDIANLKPKFIT
jgi:hypothetical protein